MIRHIFEGILQPDWHKRIDKQLKDDAGGFGEQPEHRHLRQAGRQAVRVRDDRPAHDAALRRQLGRARGLRRPDLLRPRRQRLQRKAQPPGQRLLAPGPGCQQGLQNARRKQRHKSGRSSKSCLEEGSARSPRASRRASSGAPCRRGTRMSSDQKGLVKEVLQKLVEAVRDDRDEAPSLLKAGAWTSAPARLALLSQKATWATTRCGIAGGSKGPSFVWYYRGAHMFTCGSMSPTIRASN